ncbi:hypothetical protein [Burkholderia multivorans]|uniref:hypothetical protein n=1 Tax=Burkholderia multivorans TaxID=87883 RepID=UPI0015E3A979|nr:hypothetical protein [Burkholderia multivorans]MBR7895242.1 hypothetical protein [Burkholderia multivorans]MBU9146425.1 hypothetical protein [Burkholderia multivorans]MBU9515362.1 hypothetical protein [Burkholderia multivorans]MBU9527825.1 hypothetical protein [Burkholderia multivorans]MBU9539224.1 hypothetical protein [Burkholderia multivorans]
MTACAPAPAIAGRRSPVAHGRFGRIRQLRSDCTAFADLTRASIARAAGGASFNEPNVFTRKPLTAGLYRRFGERSRTGFVAPRVVPRHINFRNARAGIHPMKQLCRFRLSCAPCACLTCAAGAIAAMRSSKRRPRKN